MTILKLVLLINLTIGSLNAYARLRMIYGADDRHEVDAPHNLRSMVTASNSVGMILSRYDIKERMPGRVELTKTSLKEKYNLCPNQAFGEQPAPGLCSGFLIGPDLFATAGHCVPSSVTCANIAIVFNFSASALHPEKKPENIKREDIFLCRSILHRVIDRDAGIDFALIQLNQPTPNRKPLLLRLEGVVSESDRLTSIGHPAGLPMKITSGGTIRNNVDPAYFVSDLDTFVGSSGSPVLNERTGLVEGIVVRGGRDWVVTDKGCRVYNRCAQEECRGEDIVRITAILDYLPGRS